jgi:hypothetical protein
MNSEHTERRQKKLQKMQENKVFLKQWEETNKRTHAAAMTVKREREKMDLRFELTMKEKKDRKQKVLYSILYSTCGIIQFIDNIY